MLRDSSLHTTLQDAYGNTVTVTPLCSGPAGLWIFAALITPSPTLTTAETANFTNVVASSGGFVPAPAAPVDASVYAQLRFCVAEFQSSLAPTPFPH